MSPDDWEQIKQVFATALSVPSAHRAAYLTLACAERADLRAAVDELLRAHYETSQGFLEPESLVFRAAWLFQIGDDIAGRFRVVKPIARGANGEVYHVFDERLHLHVALKAIRPELIGDPDTVDRFKREVGITRDIAHDGLCRVFDLVEHSMPPQAGLPDGAVIPCLTMQLLDGISLEDWLTNHRPMPVGEALPLIRQIAETTQVLHDAGIVHRDLKPSNVMLVTVPEGMRAVITDFGLAKPVDQGIFETQGPVQGGAPFFMAPELFRGERPSLASDIYAFGLLIDEMVTRERAFSADSLHALLLQKMGNGPSRPSARADQMPRSWELAILRCVAPDPRDRYASVSAAMSAVEGKTVRSLAVRLFELAYLPRRWRFAAYVTAAVLALTGVAALGASTTPTSSSVLILPFENLTGQVENDYLSIGTAAELGRRLNRVAGLQVYAARDASDRVSLSKRAPFSLTGHVQQAGPTLRITAELTDTRTGSLAWSQNYDGPRDQALELEDRLAVDAVSALTKATARAADPGSLSALVSAVNRNVAFWRRAALPTAITANSAAFDAYMRGRYLYEERTLASALAAIEHLNRAVELDPNFAAAYATLADVQQVLMEQHYAPHDRLLADAERYAVTAVALDPNLPDAQLSVAAVRQMQSQWSDAERAYRLALDLHPSFARAKRWFGGMLLQFGRFDESLKLFDEAIALDPYDYPSRSAYGLALFYAKRPVDAAAQLEKLLTEKDLFNAHAVLGQVYSVLGAHVPVRGADYLRMALQQSDILRRMELGPSGDAGSARTEYADFVGALAWSYQGDLAAAQPFLDRLESGRAQRHVSPSMLARVYAVQRRGDDALTALEDSESEQDRELMYLSVSPLYEYVRNEPRFRALMARKHLPN